MERAKAKAIIENLLLVTDKPLTLKRINEVFGEESFSDKYELKGIVDELIKEYKERNIDIMEIAMGYRFCTREEHSEWIKKFHRIEKGKRLSRAAIEILSIITYRQPITRSEIDSIRGVDSGGVIRTLFDKKLIKGVGRKKVIGKPLMYGTSKKFLEYFGLKSLADLPTIEEFNEEYVNMVEVPSGEEQAELNLFECLDDNDISTPKEENEKKISDI